MDANYGMKVKYKMDVSYIIKKNELQNSKVTCRIQKWSIELKNEL